MNELAEEELCRTARLKTMLLKQHLSKKLLIDHHTLHSLQSELAASKTLIEKISAEKESLKKALSKALYKRDEIYKKCKSYKQLLKSQKVFSDLSLSNLSQKFEFESSQLQVEHRDKKIKELHIEVEQLENLLMKHEMEIETWKQLYSASNYAKNDSTSARFPDYSQDILIIGEKFVTKLKKNEVLYKTFKGIGNCGKYFLKLLDKRVWDEALIKLLSFCEVLLTSFKIENALMRTPSFSPHQQVDVQKEDSGSCKHVSILSQDTSGKEFSGVGKSILRTSQSLTKPRVARMKQKKVRDLI